MEFPIGFLTLTWPGSPDSLIEDALGCRFVNKRHEPRCVPSVCGGGSIRAPGKRRRGATPDGATVCARFEAIYEKRDTIRK